MFRYFIKALYLTILLLLMLSLGCSVPLTPSASTKALKIDLWERKIPIKAVVVFSKKFEDLKITSWIDKGESEPNKGGIINVKVGKSSVKLFKKTLPLLFEDVKFVSEFKTLEPDKILIIPEIVEAKAYLENNKTCIEYKVSLFNPNHKTILQTSAHGSAYYKTGGGEALANLIVIFGTGFFATGTLAGREFCQSFAKAQTQAMNKLIENFKSSSELMTYAYASKLEPGIQLFKEGKRFYVKAKFDKANEKLEEAVDIFQRCPNNPLRNQFLARTYLLMGCTYIGKGQREIAKENFGRALDLDRKASLDPALASPKIQELFNKIREKTNGKNI